VIRGIPVAPGVARAKILVIGQPKGGAIPRTAITEEEIPLNLERLQNALIATRQEVLKIQKKVAEMMGSKDASIFEAHLMVLEDQTLIDEVTRLMESQRVNVEFAFNQVASKFVSELGKIDDEYLRERAADMRDVTARVMNHLLGIGESNDLSDLKDACIVVSHDLAPGTTAMLDKAKVLGFATDIGSKTSHTAIMARAMKIPAVVGLRNATSQLTSGQSALIDGYNGLLVVNPTDQTLYNYGQIIRLKSDLDHRLTKEKDKAAETTDGHRIMLSANMARAEDIEAVVASGAEGVGLFRSEFLYLNRDNIPDEQEQFEIYKRAAIELQPHPVVIRTLDLGGDKLPNHTNSHPEWNSFMGLRAIRICLDQPDIFRPQIRAILRASAFGNIKMMYPLISGNGELQQARKVVEQCKEALRQEHTAFNENIDVGAMIEVPSAALTADSISRQVKFLSIGTNDLIQYAIAVDRMNERVAHLYEPTHPAVIRLIKMTVDSAHKNGIWAGVCGEMAGDPELVPLLLGLEIDEISVAPPLISQIKYLIRRLSMKRAVEFAQFALSCDSSEEILIGSRELAHRAAPALFEEAVVNQETT